MNILIVDDEPVQLESLRRGLNSKGYKVFEATNAEEALFHLNSGNNKENKIDLVLLDYDLPGINGIELLKIIREKHGFLPVVIMTGYVRMDDVIDLLHNRCDGFIEKPFTLKQLIEEIERVRLSHLEKTESKRQ